MRTAEEYGAEALHARHLDAPYRPGRRSRSWLRVPLRRSGLVVVGGWNAGRPAPAGQRRRAAARRARPRRRTTGLRYVGRVGYRRGEEQREIAALLARSRRRRLAVRARRSPAASPPRRSGSRPRLVGRVEFADWTADGRLRLPAWRGRVDRDPAGPPLAASPASPAPSPPSPAVPRQARRDGAAPAAAPPGSRAGGRCRRSLPEAAAPERVGAAPRPPSRPAGSSSTSSTTR